MSVDIAPINLAGLAVGSTGTLDIQAQTGHASNQYQSDSGGVLRIFNESGSGLRMNDPISRHSFNLPAGGWMDYKLDRHSRQLDFSVIYNLSNPPVSLLFGTYYAPGEDVPPMVILGNSPLSGLIQSATLSGTAKVFYGSAVTDNAFGAGNNDMATVSGGVETSNTSTISPAIGSPSVFSIASRGGAVLALSSLPSTPQGLGWIIKPGNGSFANAAWNFICTLSFAIAPTSLTLAVWKIPNGVPANGVLIGNIIFSGSIVTTKTTYIFPSTILPATAFAATDWLEFDLFGSDPTNSSGYNPTVYEGTTAANGVPNDMQVTSSPFM